MKNLKLNSDKIIEGVISSNDFTAESVENVIKNLSWHKSLTIVDGESEAEEIFKEWFADADGGYESYFKTFGGVHSNTTESFILNITDPDDDYTHQFKINIIEYYIDSGSVDYIYGVSVSQL